MPVAEDSSRHHPGHAPLVSIGLPVYNGERFLGEALDALLSQTLADFELIIADNASRDATPEICRRYRERDARIRYFRHDANIGAPRNWNFAAQQARGTFFKWASCNDVCLPTLLERCVAVLKADPSVVLCQARTCLVDEQSGARQPYDHDLALLEERPSERFRGLCMRLALNNGQSGVIRRSALLRTGLDRPYEGGDFPLMAELALQGKFVVLPELLFFRRMGPSTFSCALEGRRALDFYGAEPLHQRWRVHVDTIGAALGAPIGLAEKAGVLDLALRRLLWDLWPRRALARGDGVA